MMAGAGASGPPLVEFLDVSVRVGGDHLLSHVTFAIHPGTVHVIAGPNGAGKSTLLAALLGRLAFEGRIRAHWRGDGRTGFVPQTFAVDPTVPVTVLDFLALTRQRTPVCFGVRSATRRRLLALLREVGLEEVGGRALSVLSGGELRRVLLAHALDPRPELLILDEPGAGLDAGSTQRLEAIVQRARADGTTVVLVSHDAAQVERLADRVTVLDRRVVHDGAPRDVLTPDVRAWLPTAPETRG